MKRLALFIVTLVIAVTAFPHARATAAPDLTYLEENPTAFVQGGKLVASVVGGRIVIDAEHDMTKTAVFTSINTHARFAPGKDVTWTTYVLRDCTDDVGGALKAKTNSVAAWTCKVVPPPPTAPKVSVPSKAGPQG